nr:reverse transcriptase domain-containing protein [Tanacetum cinerariifolium]
MRTRSQSRNNFPQQEASPIIVEPLHIEFPFLEDQSQENPPPEVPMADNRTMAELLQAPTEGYEDAIVIHEITANNFELKHGLINLVQNKQFFEHDKEDPHAHIRYFNKIISTMRVPNVPSSSIKLMLFSFSLEGAARIWLEKEAPRSIQTWDDLVSKFINQFFSPSKTTNLYNEIMRFQQRLDESFYEAWERFNDLLRACPHHGFSELHQLDKFYNALNINDQDSLNSAAGGNFLDKMPRECLKIIESKSKVRQSRAKAVIAKIGTSSSTPAILSDVAEFKDMVKALLLDKKNQSPAPVKAVEPNCVTCGGTHSYQNCPATHENAYRGNIQEYVSQAAVASYNQGNTSFQPQMGAARIWLEKEAPRSILTWDDLVTKFINQFFPPSKTTNLRNKITRFQQRFDESFYEAWDHFTDLLRACPHHGFFDLHQLDTFYNALNINDQDSLNSAAGGNFLDKMPQECLKIIESKSKVHQSQAKAVVAKVGTSSSTPAISSEVFELKDMVRALLLDKKNQSSAPAQSSTPAPVKAIEPRCVTCGVRQSRAKAVVAKVNSNSSTPAISSDVAELKDMVRALLLYKKNQSSAQATSPTPAPIKAVESNCVTCGGTHSYQNCPATSGNVYQDNINDGVAYKGPTIPTPSKVVKQVSAPMPNLKPSIPYPSRHDNERRREQANEQIDKFYEIFKDISFVISFTDALIPMPKFASTLKALIGNKEKLSEMAQTPMNEHCSTVILNELPKKLGDPGKFLIPCKFPRMDECLALADLGASINLMPLFVWKELSLPEHTPTCMTLELVDRLVSKPIGITKDVKVKVGMFYFPADFVVVGFEPDPRVPLILGRCFLKTGRALIDVHKGELTLRIENEAMTYNLDQTSRYSANYDQMTANKNDVTDEACEEYFQEVLSFSDVTTSGSLTPSDDPIVSTTSPTLTPFGDSDFLLFEEANDFRDPAPSLPNHEQSVPSFTNELKACEAKMIKSSFDEHLEVELKDLPPHLEYAFLEGDNKLLVIIAKELGGEEKAALIKILKSHKRAIAWKLSDIQGINPKFCTHKILMEEDYKPAIQHQRRVNPKIHDVIKKEVEKLLDAGLIYPISDSPWVSP